MMYPLRRTGRGKAAGEHHPVQPWTVVVELDWKAIENCVTRLEVEAERPMESDRHNIPGLVTQLTVLAPCRATSLKNCLDSAAPSPA
jgi:hypothetical protein